MHSCILANASLDIPIAERVESSLLIHPLVAQKLIHQIQGQKQCRRRLSRPSKATGFISVDESGLQQVEMRNTVLPASVMAIENDEL